MDIKKLETIETELLWGDADPVKDEYEGIPHIHPAEERELNRWEFGLDYIITENDETIGIPMKNGSTVICKERFATLYKDGNPVDWINLPINTKHFTECSYDARHVFGTVMSQAPASWFR